MVALGSARTSANTAKAITFDTYNYHAFGAEALAMWDFNATDKTKDSSQYGNSLSLYDTSPATDAKGKANSALSFNGASSYAVSSNPIILGTDWTISMWVYPNSAYADQVFYSQYLPYISFSTNQFQVGCDTAGKGPWDPNTSRTINTWYQVTISRNSSNGYWKTYVNGQLVEIDTTHTCVTGSSNKAYLGKHQQGNYYFNGIVDDVRVYKQALPAYEIQKLYAEGLPNHPLAQK
jgi:hypothetical protein